MGLRMLLKGSKKYTDIIIGGNIGKNKITPNELANSDYIRCLKKYRRMLII